MRSSFPSLTLLFSLGALAGCAAPTSEPEALGSAAVSRDFAASIQVGRLVVRTDEGRLELADVEGPLDVRSQPIVRVRTNDNALYQAEIEVIELGSEKVLLGVHPFEGSPAPEVTVEVVERTLRSAVRAMKTGGRPETDCDDGIEALVHQLGCAEYSGETSRSTCSPDVRDKDRMKIRQCTLGTRAELTACAPKTGRSLQRECRPTAEACPAIAEWAECCSRSAGTADCGS